MAKIGKAVINVKTSDTELLEKILAAVERIEEQGMPREPANYTVVVNSTGLDEQAVADAASRSLYWDATRKENGATE